MLQIEPSTSVATWGPTLVVAPHPDDEALGCGGAIALLRRAGCPVRVLVMSDGTQSHPCSRRYPAPALRALREAESLAGLAILGVPPEAVTFLGLQDRAVPTPASADFSAVVTRCRAALAAEAVAPRTILLPWRRDPHPDHRATWQVVRAAVAHWRPAPRLLEYPIWLWELDEPGAAPLPGEVVAWRLDVGDGLAHKAEAIASHRSQTTGLIDDDPTGFQLTPAMLAHFARPWELFLEGRR